MTSLTAETLCKSVARKDFRAHCLERLMERYPMSEAEAEEVLVTHEQLFKYEVGVEFLFKGSTVGSLVYCIKPSTHDPRVFYPVRKYYPDVKKFLLITYLHPSQVATNLRKIANGTWEPWMNG